MSQQTWLHLYGTVKSEIDKYVSDHPKALKNVLNFKKMIHASEFQKTLQKIIDRGHPSVQQEIGPETSRKTLLSRIRRWLDEPFHWVTAPLMMPSRQFIGEARQYFDKPEHNQDVFYGALLVPAGRHYHFFIVKTTTIHSDIQGYSPNTLYLVVIVDRQTVEVLPLS